jgi:alpha-galactosidase
MKGTIVSRRVSYPCAALVLLAFWTLLSQVAAAVAPTAAEMAEAGQWVAATFKGDPKDKAAELFFSFLYDGKPSAELLGTWKVERAGRKLDEQRSEHTLTYTDPKTGLAIRCVGIEYHDFPAVQWTLYLKNTGGKDTPVIENLQALDAALARSAKGQFVIHHARGSDSSYQDFASFSDRVPTVGRFSLFSHWVATGCPSVESLPMFNVEWDQQGVIAAIGWTGPWIADFQREGEAEKVLRVRAVMDRTHLRLRPGEEIRSPRVMLLFWKGDRVNAHNLWRRLMFAHNSPRPGGKPFTGMFCASNWGSWMSADGHVADIDWWVKHQIPVECYWMDAGWTDMNPGWIPMAASHTPNKGSFPRGLRPVSDAAHRRGLNFLLWFDPSKIHPGVGMAVEHPEWVSEKLPYSVDMGDSKVVQFMIDYYSKIITDFGIDVFRQDGTNNWATDSSPDRVGINQIRCTEGFYAFWDGLIKNHPNLLIDNCGCGARKLDLETISRSVVLWRSDCQAPADFDPISNQSYNQGLFPWVPLHGGAVPMAHKLTAYAFRSAYCPALVLAWPLKPVSDLEKERWSQLDANLMRRLAQEYLAVRPYVFGDYYPLTPQSLDQGVWAAWQFDRPDLGEGMVQAFRRKTCAIESAHYRLRGLESDAEYILTNLDVPGTTQMTGRALAEQGLTIAIKDQPGAVIITYKKKQTPVKLANRPPFLPTNPVDAPKH